MDAAECKRLRERAGWTQAQMATAMSVNRVTVAQWEGGVRNISEPHAKLMRLLVEAERTKPQRQKRRR